MRRPGRALAAAGVCAGLAAALPAPAVAGDVSSARFRELAARAQHDPAALAELERVDSVDGRPVATERILSGDRAEVQARLETLAAGDGGGAGASPGSAAARSEAADILAERRFHEREPPRPLRRPLEWLGERLRSLERWLAPRVPGGESTLWLVLAALVVAAAALAAVRLARRRLRGGAGDGPPHPAERRADPAALERAAEEAERRGELERAVRLRFRAGLLRLADARAVPLRESTTTGEVARALRSPAFDRVAAGFEQIAYGGRPAGAPDVRAAREGWRRVLEEAGAR